MCVYACVCVYLAELLCACVLVRTRVIVLFGFMTARMRVYVWMYVIERVRVSECKHVSVWLRLNTCACDYFRFVCFRVRVCLYMYVRICVNVGAYI